jgi:chromosome segregation ATPase
MDERVIQETDEETTAELEGLWLEQRRRAAEILSAQKTHLDEIELQLAAQVELISSRLTAGLTDAPPEHDAELERLRAELAERQLEMEQAQETAALELQQWADQLRQKQHDLEQREEELNASLLKFKEAQRNSATSHEEYDAQLEVLEQRKARLDEQQKQLEAESRSLEASREETKNQRRRIAHKLKDERARYIEELALQRQELESLRESHKQEADRATNELQQQLAAQESQLAQKQELLNKNQKELEKASTDLNLARRQLQEAQQELERAHATAKDAAAGRDAETQAEVARLHEQCDQLAHKCAEKQTAVAEQLVTNAGLAAKLEEAQREIEHLHNEWQAAAELAHGVEQELTSLRAAYDDAIRQAATQDSRVPPEQIDSLTAERNTLQARLAELEAQLAKLSAERTSLINQNEELDTSLRQSSERETARQQELVAERDALLARLDTAKADLQAAVVGAEKLAALEAEREELVCKLADANGSLEQVRRELAAEQQSAETAREELFARFQEAQKETAAIGAKLREAESRLAAGQTDAAATPNNQQAQDLQRRFELAVEDVRSLKRKNAELEDKISALKAGRGESASGGAHGKDWESLKKKMLEELEADTDHSAARKEERISIENTIRITDDIVAEKDREIEELKQLLSEQSNNLGSLAVGAAAVEEMFNQDEAIQHERQRLQEAQNEWREKLRQSEIDISLERACLARQRVELEEKLRAIETERAQIQATVPGSSAAGTSKSSRGRWLERLGLKDNEKK